MLDEDYGGESGKKNARAISAANLYGVLPTPQSGGGIIPILHYLGEAVAIIGMSINSKNLTYESNEPEFLKRLRGEYGGSDLGRHQRPQARPKKQRNASEENDDEPVYVHNEDPHEPISKAAYDTLWEAPPTEQLSVKEAQQGKDVQASDGNRSLPQVQASEQPEQEQPSKEQQAKEKIAEIGGGLKKRSARVVGDDAFTDEVPKSATSQKAKKQKGKRVKLSFQDDLR
ncbi:MAG: hypothetical protein Q9166_000538 [cf. Caloplaca sp. 2 TL-2023]